MGIGTTRLNQQNAELFATLNKELKSLQSQVGSGKKDLKLSENLYDISKLNAAEEKKFETLKFLENSKRVARDLEHVDLALDRIQNLVIRLQELSVETANDVLDSSERERAAYEANIIKSEIFDLANQQDSFGNYLFSGVAGGDKPFSMDAFGNVTYNGSAMRKTVHVSDGMKVDQNFSGQEVFSNIGTSNNKTSLFNIIDDFVASLKVDLTSTVSSNLFSDSNSVDLVFPSTGAEAKVSFDLVKDGQNYGVSANVYGNDYSVIVSAINSHTASTGVSASIVTGNRLRLQGTVSNLSLTGATFSNYQEAKSDIAVIKDTSSSNVVERISENRLTNGVISDKISESFQLISDIRTEVSSSSQLAQQSQASAQDLLILLEDDISKIKDADLAKLLTQIEFLMVNKEAAQATFTRITSKSLFDFLG